jgi:hypothetical protein
MNKINDDILKVSTTVTEFSLSGWIFVGRGHARAAAYSPFLLSNTHLVYTTEDLRPPTIEMTRFFGWMQPEKSAYALRID